MEAVEELPMHIPGFEGVKDNLVDIPEASAAELTKDCQKTNGVSGLPEMDVGHVADSITAEPPQSSHHEAEVLGGLEVIGNEPNQISDEQVVTTEVTADSTLNEPSTADSGLDTANERVDVDSSNISEFDVETSVCDIESTVIETELDGGTILDSTDEKVLVDQEETVISTTNDCSKIHYDTESDNKILTELDGHSLDLSEALGTPDVPDGSENNNSNSTQEVFNKEELLDILEGNEPEQPQTEIAQRALQQLTKLARKTKRPSTGKASPMVPGKKQPISKVEKQPVSKVEKQPVNKVEKQPVSKAEKQPVSKVEKMPAAKSGSLPSKSKPKEENIVKALVEDWEDDEAEDDKAKKLLQDSELLQQASEELLEQQQEVTLEDHKPPVDSTMSDDQSLNKSSDEGPQRRLGRVIKKKVIFDPDNPDTFTKGKIVKNKEPQSETPPPPKKVKPEQAVLRANSKSPVNKTQWKKPTPKKSSQHKRLTEVDKLLMDEGAVNMMYQLTPEAPKGRKNMRTKAEFIKKINQSSTPDAKEMKFRERKKDMPKDEGEGKKGVRTSLSGSVKSASLAEDFENTSADDSIIYRRHSSSSYSSTCMSPRRLSDVESGAGVAQTVAQALQQTAESISAMDCEPTENGQLDNKDIFMANVPITLGSETMKKKDCLTLKEKLNSKLSNVLNKRKREIKTDKPMKQKKLTPKLDKSKETVEKVVTFKTLALSFNDRVAEICIEKSECPNNLCGLQVILELKQALELINDRKDTSITLLASETVSICSNLDLKPLLDTNLEKKITYALEITSAIRSLLWCLGEHSKVLVCGAEGACSGLALAVLALCDVAAASELASFALAATRAAPPLPAVAALTAPSSRLSRALVNELVICGRRLSAREAVELGLVSRALWPAGFGDQLRAWGKDLAAQPLQSLLMRKKLLGERGAASKSTFQSMLASEQEQVSAHWGSLEGQEHLRAHFTTAQ